MITWTPRSLRLLGRSTTIVVPRGAAGLLRRRGFRELIELAAGEETELRGMRIRAIPAVHRARAAARSGPALRPSATWSGTDARRLAITGAPTSPGTPICSTGWGAWPAALTWRCCPWPAGAVESAAGHLDPPRAAEAARRLSPRLAVPIHWGTFAEAWSRRERHRMQPPRVRSSARWRGSTGDPGRGGRAGRVLASSRSRDQLVSPCGLNEVPPAARAAR